MGGREGLSTTVLSCLSAVCREESTMSGSTALLCLELLERLECDPQECVKVCVQVCVCVCVWSCLLCPGAGV